jgi:hypothetical protein
MATVIICPITSLENLITQPDTVPRRVSPSLEVAHHDSGATADCMPSALAAAYQDISKFLPLWYRNYVSVLIWRAMSGVVPLTVALLYLTGYMPGRWNFSDGITSTLQALLTYAPAAYSQRL